MEFELLNKLEELNVSIKQQRDRRGELQGWNFRDYIGTLFWSPKYMNCNTDFKIWWSNQYKVVEQISQVRKEVEELDNEIYKTEQTINNIYNEIKNIQKKYQKSKYFDIDRLRVGMKVEYDYSCGLNSSGVDYILVKIKKTYVEGYSIVGEKIGPIIKITKPKQLVFLY